MKTVRVVIADIPDLLPEAEQIVKEIAPYYREKYEKIKIPEEAAGELAAGFLLKRCMGVSKDEEIIREPGGKPYLSPDAELGHEYFNLSHSAEKCVLAIAECEVGVDVEKIIPFHYAAAKKVFGEEKAEWMLTLEEKAKNEEYTKWWTVCEAVLKLTGRGFSEGWEKDLDKKFHVKSQKIGSYYLSYATKEPVFEKTVHF